MPFADYPAWLSWLKKNFRQQEGIWVKFGKKQSGVPSMTYEEAREGAIIYGWIDGLINSYDETWYLTRFTPRRPRSKWSKINRGIAEELIRSGKMQPSGMAEVEAARADGRWDAAYDSPSRATVPPELASRLKRNRKAREFFESLSRTSRYSFLAWIQNAVRPETRRRRIEQTMEMLEKGEVPQSSIRKKK